MAKKPKSVSSLAPTPGVNAPFVSSHDQQRMAEHLSQPDHWRTSVHGNLTCPVCGVLLHPMSKDTHIAWHQFFGR